MTTIDIDEATRNVHRGRPPRGPRQCPPGFSGRWSDLTPEQRFWAKVDRRGPDECWPWLAGLNGRGYGQFESRGHNGAHRYAYELVVGPIPDGLQLDHLCRTRACVNPAHLEPVTNRENVLRGIGVSALAARATHCPQGHLYSPDNTILRANGNRVCRRCKNAYMRRWWAARKQAVA